VKLTPIEGVLYEACEQAGSENVCAVQETPQHVLQRQEVQEGRGSRPVPAVSQEPVGLGLATTQRIKSKLVRILLWIGAIGPTALLVADRVAHFFGICLGH
jgi:hypothetical protein